MKKRIFALCLCLVVVAVTLPAAAALRKSDDPEYRSSGVNFDANYAKAVDDFGVWTLVVRNNGTSTSPVWGFDVIPPAEYVEPGTANTPMSLDTFIMTMISDMQKRDKDGAYPGYERAITFKFELPVDTAWDGIWVNLTMKQINVPDPEHPGEYLIAIPIDRDKSLDGVSGPRDDRGNTDNAVTPPDGTEQVFSRQDVDGWDGPVMADQYQTQPANLLDKIQYTVYAKSVAAGAACPFRDSNGAPYAPNTLDTIVPRTAATYGQTWSSDWMTMKDNVENLSAYAKKGETLYIHYNFYWDGGYFSVGNPESAVSPKAYNPSNPLTQVMPAGTYILRYVDDPSGAKDANGKPMQIPVYYDYGKETYILHDNYYMASRAAFQWVSPYFTEKPVEITPPNNNTPTNPPTTVEPTPPPEEIIETPPPEAPPPPTDNGEETVAPTQPPTSMPFTGGFNLGNLFFVGLFLVGIGLIFLVSRKKREEKEEDANS